MPGDMKKTDGKWIQASVLISGEKRRKREMRREKGGGVSAEGSRYDGQKISKDPRSKDGTDRENRRDRYGKC